MIEQPALPLDPAAIPGERTIRSNHAMTRDNDSHGIRSVGETDSPNRSRAADAFGELSVGDSRAAGNLPERAPNLELKWSATSLNLQRIQDADLSSEVASKRIGKPVWIPSGFKQESATAELLCQLPTDGFLILSEKSEAQAPRPIADNHHPANRRGKSINKEVNGITHHRPIDNRCADSLTPTNQAQSSDVRGFAVSLRPTPHFPASLLDHKIRMQTRRRIFPSPHVKRSRFHHPHLGPWTIKLQLIFPQWKLQRPRFAGLERQPLEAL
jgi:hypothetical protein